MKWNSFVFFYSYHSAKIKITKPTKTANNNNKTLYYSKPGYQSNTGGFDNTSNDDAPNNNKNNNINNNHNNNTKTNDHLNRKDNNSDSNNNNINDN